MDKKFWKLCTLSLPTDSGMYEVRVAEKGDPLSCPITTTANFSADTETWNISREFCSHEVIAWRCL